MLLIPPRKNILGYLYSLPLTLGSNNSLGLYEPPIKITIGGCKYSIIQPRDYFYRGEVYYKPGLFLLLDNFSFPTGGNISLDYFCPPAIIFIEG